MPAKGKTAKPAAAVSKMPPIFSHELAVVGLGFRLKRDVRQSLARLLDASKTGGIDVKLVREQENKYDVNAIKVLHNGSGILKGKHLGYIRADTAEMIAPLMDDGKRGGFTLKAAKLTEMDAADDHKTGMMMVEFYDWRKRA